MICNSSPLIDASWHFFQDIKVQSNPFYAKLYITHYNSVPKLMHGTERVKIHISCVSRRLYSTPALCTQEA